MAQPTKTGAPVEKWAHRIRLFMKGTPHPQETPNAHVIELPDPYFVKDLTKTAEENATIVDVVAGINRVIQALCTGRDLLAFSADRVHVVTQAEFTAQVSNFPGAQGKSMLGHAYLWRGWPLSTFMALMTHEVLHAISYLWLDFFTAGYAAPDGLARPPIYLRRQGMLTVDDDPKDRSLRFNGLNECVTETFSFLVRHVIAQQSAILDIQGRAALAAHANSPPQIAFMDRIIRTAADGGSDIDVWRMAVLDYLDGTDDFLALLESKLPGATAVLKPMGSAPPELLKASAALGFLDLLPQIRPYCP